jgi:hypothetical protein
VKGTAKYPWLSSSHEHRANLKVYVPGFGNMLWHRLLASVYHKDTYEEIGGIEHALPNDLEDRAHLQVDHGPKGTAYVLVGDLRWVTRDRNFELEAERKKKGRKKKKAAKE